MIDLSTDRMAYCDLALVETYLDERANRAMAKLACKCGDTARVQLSRWRHDPPQRCPKCTIKKNGQRFPGSRPR